MKSRDERIEARYHLSARDLAERLVDAEDEAARLRTQVKVADAKVAAVKPYVDGVNARIRMLEDVVDVYDDIHGERDRYRLAWLSARRRAAEEAALGAQAVDELRAARSYSA